jgi:uncharacterized protein (DUF1501 family)
MLIKRRNFIRTGSLAAAGTLLLPKFLQAIGQQHLAGKTDRKLVIIQLSGGNDGLNTVIPYRNDIYYQLRPKLGIKGDKAQKLDDETALHHSLQGLAGLYQSGEMAILNNVGYPNPDRSHFRSMDIWHTASPASEYWHTGWLGRYLDAACNGCAQPTQAIEIDEVLSLALKGNRHKGLAFQDAGRLYQTSNSRQFRQLAAHHADGDDPLADYLYKTLAETLQSADLIFQASKRGMSSHSYPDTGLGRQLKTIASLIAGELDTRVYYVSLGSFDTHVNQEFQQARLLKELNDGVVAFVGDLKSKGLFGETLVMTFSEFGRRVAQNASGGTDHGTANQLFLIGGGLRRAGMLNALPDLSNLADGDLQHTVDFRQVYATLLGKWLDAPAENVLGQSFDLLDFV